MTWGPVIAIAAVAALSGVSAAWAQDSGTAAASVQINSPIIILRMVQPGAAPTTASGAQATGSSVLLQGTPNQQYSVTSPAPGGVTRTVVSTLNATGQSRVDLSPGAAAPSADLPPVTIDSY